VVRLEGQLRHTRAKAVQQANLLSLTHRRSDSLIERLQFELNTAYTELNRMRHHVHDMEAKFRDARIGAEAEGAAAHSKASGALAEMRKAQKEQQHACEQHKAVEIQLRTQVASATRKRNALVLSLAAAAAELLGGVQAREEDIAEVGLAAIRFSC
jgi:hypothetical protein